MQLCTLRACACVLRTPDGPVCARARAARFLRFFYDQAPPAGDPALWLGPAAGGVGFRCAICTKEASKMTSSQGHLNGWLRHVSGKAHNVKAMALEGQPILAPIAITKWQGLQRGNGHTARRVHERPSSPPGAARSVKRRKKKKNAAKATMISACTDVILHGLYTAGLPFTKAAPVSAIAEQVVDLVVGKHQAPLVVPAGASSEVRTLISRANDWNKGGRFPHLPCHEGTLNTHMHTCTC